MLLNIVYAKIIKVYALTYRNSMKLGCYFSEFF